MKNENNIERLAKVMGVVSSLSDSKKVELVGKIIKCIGADTLSVLSVCVIREYIKNFERQTDPEKILTATESLITSVLVALYLDGSIMLRDKNADK